METGVSEIVAIEVTEEEIAFIADFVRFHLPEFGSGWAVLDDVIRKVYEALPETAVR